MSVLLILMYICESSSPQHKPWVEVRMGSVQADFLFQNSLQGGTVSVSSWTKIHKQSAVVSTGPLHIFLCLSASVCVMTAPPGVHIRFWSPQHPMGGSEGGAPPPCAQLSGTFFFKKLQAKASKAGRDCQGWWEWWHAEPLMCSYENGRHNQAARCCS